jgi:DNA-binding transcriptional MerR regulator
VAELAGEAAKILADSGLAQQRGTVSEVPDERTIRYYLTESLIPPAEEKQGTASVFGYRHLLQLLVVKKLQSEHLPIRKIRDLVNGRSERELERLLGTESVGAVKNEALSYLEQLLTKRAKLAAGRDQTVDVLIRITPPEIDAGVGRRPRLNLSLVLDRSGSMAGEKMLRAREATAYCVDQLLPSDRVSVIVFDDIVEVLIPSQLVSNKAQLKGLRAEVYARNSTALHEAWVRGGLQISEHLTVGAVNRVLLITDGLANEGLTNVDQIVSQVKGLSERGVSTSTIGIGDDFNEDLLVPMARAGDGNSWHVKTADDMQRIFAVELEGLIAQVAHTVTLGLVPADGVRLSDALNDFEMGETRRYKLPNLQAGPPAGMPL